MPTPLYYGVVEPASATPVIVEDNVLIGANAKWLSRAFVLERALLLQQVLW